MLKTIVSAVAAMTVLCSCQMSAQGSEPTEAVAAYDGTGVQPPKEILLQEGKTIGDIKLPKGSAIDAKKSIILGSGPNSFGKIYAGVKADSEMVTRFFLDNMPADGWELISEFQADDTTLTYQKPTRVVIVLIERGSRSTSVRITLTPRS
ncbi:hypothetical protein [Kordiimonas pumila]|uniref:Lipoprotein n=1 Tax=Kordiimonas pumila TaxID=2161677 RepID=A0ABV7D3X6_9PROT|nr:hypothetical protein [Kordiimonas pumila]